VLIRAHGEGLSAHTLNFDYEVRSAEEAFSELPDGKADDEMLDLALHIIKKKGGAVRPDHVRRPLRCGAGRVGEGQDGRPQDHAAQGAGTD
jgi:non-homologous end joining protein Ku